MAAPKGAEDKAGAPAPADPPAPAEEETPTPAPEEAAPEPAPEAEPEPAPEKEAAPKKDKPSVRVKMSWVAIGVNYGASPQVIEGLPIVWPQMSKLNLIGEGGKNTLIAPRPKDWVEALAAKCRYIKRVSGRLPDLVLWPNGEGDNAGIWAEYRQKHPEVGMDLSPIDWSPDRTLSHKAKGKE